MPFHSKIPTELQGQSAVQPSAVGSACAIVRMMRERHKQRTQQELLQHRHHVHHAVLNHARSVLSA